MRRIVITLITLNIFASIALFNAFRVGADEIEPTPSPVLVAPEIAQAVLSPTPLRVILPTLTPIPTEGFIFTPTPTFTPTTEGPVQLRVLGADPVNVRSLADIESDILGTIRPEETYTVLGRLFMWYQIVFDSSPNGRGWVFEGLVEIIGDPSAIPDLSIVTPTPPLGQEVLAPTQTQEALNAVPGGEMTATANSRVIEAPSGDTAGGIVSGDSSGTGNVLPTFTYPPNFEARRPVETQSNEATPMPETTGSAPVSSEGVAPIVPIVFLFGFGLIGLLISSLRR